MDGDAASLREAAPQWSLAGDKQLLGMLQKIHQKIVTKCEEANVKLDAMVDALDNANIDLQNVSNKFMALNNNQFVESRVYDDDVDILTEGNTAKSEISEVATESEVTKLKRSLQRLEQKHEPVHILDSDSSDDEDVGRIILRPKDIYSHRPLPHIIGTQAWKNKWHAGLLQEESDSDSSVSKRDNMPAEEYSESEPETAPTDKLANRTISSSSLESEVALSSGATSRATTQPLKPADIAAELARRLGGPVVQVPASEPVAIKTAEATSKKVYRVEKPAPTTVFSDEPPPLDDDQPYNSDYSDDDDIFAELNKKPYPKPSRDENRVSKNLFGGINDNVVDELFGERKQRDTDIGNIVNYRDVTPSTSIKEQPPSFNDILESNSISDKPVTKSKPVDIIKETEGTVKKPIGGISLFGSNTGAESIGAAILKRNQRKPSSSDEEINDIPKNKHKVPNIIENEQEPVNKIIEDLFNKPSKKVPNKEHTIKEPENTKPVKDKIDLFSDNLFDDIDDIFTTNIVTQSHENRKSIFGDDDDDLFADITVMKPKKHNIDLNTKSVFDNQDDILFSESNETFKSKNKIPNDSIINISKDNVVAEAIDTVTVFDKNVKEREVSSKTETDIFSSGNVNVSSEIDTGSYNVQSLEKTTENIIVNTKVTKSRKSYNFCNNEEFDELFREKPNIIYKQSNNSSVIENDGQNDKETPKPITSVEHGRTAQILDSEAKTTQSKIKQFIEPNNTFVQNNVTPIEAYIKSDTESEILEDTNNFSHSTENKSRKISNQSKNILSSLSNDATDITNKTISSKTSESLFEDICNITSKDTKLPKFTTAEVKPNMHTDIFDQLPPAFEKPAEPKKSKNINALFDDDSDDEALFFKKNEGICDEKPNPEYSSNRFSIFHDEPPEIDIDFYQKPSKSTPSPLSEILDEEISEVSPVAIHIAKTEVINTEEVYKSRENTDSPTDNKLTREVDITKLIEDSKEIKINDTKFVDSLNCESNNSIPTNKNMSETVIRDKPEVDMACEPKKSIGKLKPLNFNINVSSLLPGASMKKPNTSEEIDGQTISTKSNEELNIHSPEISDTKIVKSVSFEGDPESKVLDNKFSKQRAKIQVKRRPPSRRARLEAVRKSGIDFTSDSTDNSSSFEEPPYKEIVNEALTSDVDSNIADQKDSAISTISKENTKLNNEITHTIETPFSLTVDDVKDSKISSTDIKSKIVYILNDEDIFTNTNPKKENNSEIKEPSLKKKDVLSIDDDDDDDNDDFLFSSPNISTLGKTYENKSVTNSNELPVEPGKLISRDSSQKYASTEKDSNVNYIFENLSDDEKELFLRQKPAVQKNNIFDSDSDSELFADNKKNSRSTKETIKKEVVKGPLFGDESDDENDLFAIKPAKVSVVSREVSRAKDSTAQTEPVFEDPLSMFGDDS